MIDAEPSLHAAQGIRGPVLLTYLVARGWTARPTRVRGMSVLSKRLSASEQLVEILLPAASGFPDEQSRVADALRALSAMEDRSEAAISEDIHAFERNKEMKSRARVAHPPKGSKSEDVELPSTRAAVPSEGRVAESEAIIQNRGGLITYLTIALDDVEAVSPTALHLLEMAIAILADTDAEDAAGETSRKSDQRKPS